MRVASWIPEFLFPGYFCDVTSSLMHLPSHLSHEGLWDDTCIPTCFSGSWQRHMKSTNADNWYWKVGRSLGYTWPTWFPEAVGLTSGKNEEEFGTSGQKVSSMPKVEPNPVAVRKWTWWERRKAWSPPHAISESKESVRNRARTSNVRFSKIIWLSSPCISWMGKRFN